MSVRACLLLVILAFGAVGCGASLPDPAALPPNVTFNGTWDTNWGQLALIQRGSRVSGPFKGFRNGTVSGTAEGNLFLFRWVQQENQQYGRGYLQMSPDGYSLEGRWGYQDDYSNGGRWWATRASNGGN